MTLPKIPSAADIPQTPSMPLAMRTFGEARFHTPGDVAALAFASDGSIWSIDETGVLLHWGPDGKPLSRAFLSDIETLWCFSPSADLLASGNDDLILWDTKEGQLLSRLPQPSWVTSLAFNPDGSAIASGHDDGSIRFWNPRTGRLTGEIAAHPTAVSAISFAPNAELFATAGEDRVVRIWHSISHKMIQELRSHTDRIPSLAWNTDGSMLISAGWDTSARVWKPSETTDPVMLLNSHAEQVLLCTYSVDGKFLATADSDCDIHLWSNPASGKSRHILRGHSQEIRALAFNRDSSLLASAGSDRVVHVWDTLNGQLVGGPNPNAKNQVVFVPGPLNRIASTGTPVLKLWSADTGDELPPLLDSSTNCVAASRDGRYLAVGGTDHFTRLFDLTQPTIPPRMLEATKPPIGALMFSVDGRMLAQTSPADGLVWLWNTESGETDLILVEAADGCTLEAVAIHPEGNLVAAGGVDYLSTGDRDGAVVVWDVRTKAKQNIFDTGVMALGFDPKGRYLAGAGLDQLVHIWDLEKDEELFALDGHTDRIHAVAFSPDGSYVLSSGEDMLIRVWDVLTGRLVVVREFDAAIHSLEFSPDGTSLFTGNANTTCSQIEWKNLLDD